jgi:hypothetical protein
LSERFQQNSCHNDAWVTVLLQKQRAVFSTRAQPVSNARMALLAARDASDSFDRRELIIIGNAIDFHE